MAYTLENRIEAINECLQRADIAIRTLFDTSKSLGALIIAVGYLVEIVEEQQRQIGHLEDVLQDRLERRTA